MSEDPTTTSSSLEWRSYVIREMQLFDIGRLNFYIRKHVLGGGKRKTHKIITKKELAPKIKLLEIVAPEIAEKAQAGQFVILRVDEKGERIPLTLVDWDKQKGTITLIFCLLIEKIPSVSRHFIYFLYISTGHKCLYYQYCQLIPPVSPLIQVRFSGFRSLLSCSRLTGSFLHV